MWWLQNYKTTTWCWKCVLNTQTHTPFCTFCVMNAAYCCYYDLLWGWRRQKQFLCCEVCEGEFVRFCQKSHEFSNCSLEIVFQEMCPDSCGRFDHLARATVPVPAGEIRKWWLLKTKRVYQSLLWLFKCCNSLKWTSYGEDLLDKL